MPHISIDPATYRRVQQYARVAGISADLSAKKIINFWMDDEGDFLLQYVERKSLTKNNVVPISA